MQEAWKTPSDTQVMLDFLKRQTVPESAIPRVTEVLKRCGCTSIRASRCADIEEMSDTLPEYIFRDSRAMYSDGTDRLYQWQRRVVLDAHLRWPIYQQALVELSVPLLALIRVPYCVMWILEWLENFQFTNWAEYIRIKTIQRVFDSIRRIEEKRKCARKEADRIQ